MLKTLAEQEKSRGSSSQRPSTVERLAEAYLAEPEVASFRGAHLAPSVRQMADDIGEPSLYDHYRSLSYETHAGLGMHFRQVRGGPGLLRIEQLLYGCEFCLRLLAALGSTLPTSQRNRFEAVVGTLEDEYLGRLRDAYASAIYTASLGQLPEDAVAVAIAEACRKT